MSVNSVFKCIFNISLFLIFSSCKINKPVKRKLIVNTKKAGNQKTIEEKILKSKSFQGLKQVRKDLESEHNTKVNKKKLLTTEQYKKLRYDVADKAVILGSKKYYEITNDKVNTPNQDNIKELKGIKSNLENEDLYYLKDLSKDRNDYRISILNLINEKIEELKGIPSKQMFSPTKKEAGNKMSLTKQIKNSKHFKDLKKAKNNLEKEYKSKIKNKKQTTKLTEYHQLQDQISNKAVEIGSQKYLEISADQEKTKLEKIKELEIVKTNLTNKDMYYYDRLLLKKKALRIHLIKEIDKKVKELKPGLIEKVVNWTSQKSENHKNLENDIKNTQTFDQLEKAKNNFEKKYKDKKINNKEYEALKREFAMHAYNHIAKEQYFELKEESDKLKNDYIGRNVPQDKRIELKHKFMNLMNKVKQGEFYIEENDLKNKSYRRLKGLINEEIEKLTNLAKWRKMIKNLDSDQAKFKVIFEKKRDIIKELGKEIESFSENIKHMDDEEFKTLKKYNKETKVLKKQIENFKNQNYVQGVVSKVNNVYINHTEMIEEELEHPLDNIMKELRDIPHQYVKKKLEALKQELRNKVKTKEQIKTDLEKLKHDYQYEWNKKGIKIVPRNNILKQIDDLHRKASSKGFKLW
ncbi:MAG: hypothetical protein GY830_05845 [Bacteroidetes bacterium]|nr:hypothetical protein [Bacteroidota bacterium]